jgi:hypothetical protein
MIELTITYDNKNWIAKNEFMSVSASTLEKLDIELEKLIRQKRLIEKGKKVKILMTFDNSTIPQWIRQYSQHYFNRIIEIK